MEIERAQSGSAKNVFDPSIWLGIVLLNISARLYVTVIKADEKDSGSSQLIFHVKRNRDLYAHKFPMFVRGFS